MNNSTNKYRRKARRNEVADLLARNNKQQAEKITELERIIVEAKECVKQDQKEISELRKKLHNAELQLTGLVGWCSDELEFGCMGIEHTESGTIGEAILKSITHHINKLKNKVERLQVNRDSLFKENERFRGIFLMHNTRNDATKNQIKELLVKIAKLRNANGENLSQMENDLKLIKIHFC